MMLVPTYLAESRIHGIGVFAARPIGAGKTLWRFDERVDILLPIDGLGQVPERVGAFLKTYAYVCEFFPGNLVLNGDNARFINHADDPNTDNRTALAFARRPIAKGEEITCDYREIEGDLRL
jgi:hypothetical protein